MMPVLLILTLLFSPLTADPCELHPQGKADCSDRGLLLVPSSIPRDIQSLDLSYNSIHISRPFQETFPQLLSLNLSQNPLHLLPDRTFQNLPKLQVLDLSDCSISSLSPNSFKGLDKLEVLILRNNSLSTLHLENLKALSYLDLRQTLLISDNSHKLKRSHLLQELSNRGLCDCSSGDLLQKTDQQVSGLFCSCPVQLRGEELLLHTPRKSWSGTLRRFARDVTEEPTGSGNLTSPTPFTSGSGGKSWPILVGFLVTAICVSLLIALFAKFQLFHKYFRSYRHRPLPENDWMNQSQGELPGVPLPNNDDEDGFIEDNYIQPGDQREDEDEDNPDNMYTI
ncbi:type III endosome membrane protein TEMP isoform 2-T2 [Discoglossus pictus]